MKFTMMLDASDMKMRETNDGYLVCKPRVARTGIQTYKGKELGRPELSEVRVWRPEAEVFSKDALASFVGKPITDEHPPELITASNWKDHAVGHVGEDVLREGEFIRVPLVLMDSKAIQTVRRGKTELSVGYSAAIQWEDGVTPSGEKYDAKQTAIRANHVAITHTARGGHQLRMGDTKKETTKMATRTIMVDGINMELEERDAQLVERRIATVEKELNTAKTDLATVRTQATNDVASVKAEVATLTTQVQAKDAEVTTLKQQLADAKFTPQKLDQMVSERVATVQRAKAIIGDALVVDGKTNSDMRRQVVSAKLGDVAKDWTDEMVTASFNTLAVSVTDSGNNSLRHVSNVISGVTDSGNTRDKAYKQYEDDLQEIAGKPQAFVSPLISLAARQFHPTS